MSVELLEKKSLSAFSEEAYLNYAMYVITDRALPHIADGLKPVQRRIVYAMSELGLRYTAKYKKSARTVGDVLGKYHPHGDSACYEAMVLMAQSFSYRYPLVDGQGNWGSPDDPKSFAAMRYTESRLAPYTQLLLEELELGTVDWQANFDGTLDEPSLLPARLPNILLNGTTGIAVGMATDIPPHNLREVAAACVYLLETKTPDLEGICQHIKAPDFPGGADIVTPPDEIKKVYAAGHGSVKARAIYTVEEGNLVITALPHQVSGAKVLEQIAQQMQAKKLPMIADLRDESDHENPTRLVIEPRSNRVDLDSVMGHLFATTELERSYRINMNVIGLNAKPQMKSLLVLLQEWLYFRTETVRRRLQYCLDKINKRLHILDGLLIAFAHLDRIIQLIRESDAPKEALMQAFQLTAIQAEAILELKLRALAKLERIKLQEEQARLEKEKSRLEKILGSENLLKKLIKDEIIADAEKYGDARLSSLVVRPEAQALASTEVISADPVTLILSERGWVRQAKGHDIQAENLSYKAGDALLMAVPAKLNQTAIFFDSTGRSYQLPIHALPSARGQGEPLSGHLKPPSGAQFVGVLIAESAEQRVFLASSAGYGFIATMNDLYSKNKQGKQVLSIPANARALSPTVLPAGDNLSLLVLSQMGRLLLFPANQLPELPKGKGNKLIQIESNLLAGGYDKLLQAVFLKETDKLCIYAGKRKLILQASDLLIYKGERGRKGCLLPKGYQQIIKMEII